MKRHHVFGIAAVLAAVLVALGVARRPDPSAARNEARTVPAHVQPPDDASRAAPRRTAEPRDDESRHAALAAGDELALGIQRALVSSDARARETAFSLLLPELLRREPERVSAMIAREEPGAVRDALRDETARQWITINRDAAVLWMKALEDPAERRASAVAAMRALAAVAPEHAIYLADELGVGRDDGSLEHVVQIWAAEDPEAAARWLDAQPTDARTAQLRARMETAMARRTTPR